MKPAIKCVQLSRRIYAPNVQLPVITRGVLKETIKVVFDTCMWRGVIARRCHQGSQHTSMLLVGEVTWEVWWTWDVCSLLNGIDKRGEHLEKRRRRADPGPPETQLSAARPCVAHVDGRANTTQECVQLQANTHARSFLHVAPFGRF